MEKKEKIRKMEFEEIPALQSATETVADLKGEEINDSEENEIEEESSEENESNCEKRDDGAGKKEKERLNRLEQLFGNYPATLALLAEDGKFTADEKTATFMATVMGFARGSGMAVEEIDSALKMLFTISGVGNKGAFTLDMVEILMKGLAYDRKIAEEVQAAELRGRNANIEAKVKERTDSDGVPHLGSRGSTSERRDRGIFSLAEKAR